MYGLVAVAKKQDQHARRDARFALRFILLLGVVSLFADMTYEAARSIAGPCLAILGAGATGVGVIADLGEIVGYGLRIVFTPEPCVYPLLHRLRLDLPNRPEQ